MRVFKGTRAVAVLCLAVVAGFVNHRAFADGYTIYSLYQSSGSIDNIGLTDNGSLTTRSASTLAYTTFTPPSSFVTSPTLPAFTFDNGSGCSPSVGGGLRVTTGVCNNGREVFEAYTATSTLPSLYLLDNGILQLVYGGPVSDILLDAMGDLAFIGEASQNADTNFLYYDTTSRAAVTPEPSSLLLLGTGCAGIFAAWKRRLRQR